MRREVDDLSARLREVDHAMRMASRLHGDDPEVQELLAEHARQSGVRTEALEAKT